MKQYLNYIKRTRQLFLQRNSLNTWREMVEKANKCAAKGSEFNFSPDYHPHFYSGKLFQPFTDRESEFQFCGQNKLFFITLNPGFGPHVPNESLLRESFADDFTLDIEFQNNAFLTGNSTFGMYTRCNTLLRHVLGTYPNKDNPVYDSLNRKGVVFDLVPFYSDKFKLDHINDQLIDFLTNIVEPLSNLNSCIVAGGKDFKNAFEENEIYSALRMENVTTLIKKGFPALQNVNLSIYRKKGGHLILWPNLTGYPPVEHTSAVAALIRKLHPEI